VTLSEDIHYWHPTITIRFAPIFFYLVKDIYDPSNRYCLNYFAFSGSFLYLVSYGKYYGMGGRVVVWYGVVKMREGRDSSNLR
jgi:hypothetical protein